jgi:hypothetical protein
MTLLWWVTRKGDRSLPRSSVVKGGNLEKLGLIQRSIGKNSPLDLIPAPVIQNAEDRKNRISLGEYRCFDAADSIVVVMIGIVNQVMPLTALPVL